MSFETLKEQVDVLTDSERRRLMTYLVTVELSKNAEHAEPHPENVKFTGTAPADTDARHEYRQHLADQHR